jgi:hypothetical protein
MLPMLIDWPDGIVKSTSLVVADGWMNMGIS